ncbi:SDR family NAD(P)-dependent oxidoreductase [Mesorhizobium sp. CO1-1-8]|uniref:SDR family NAD(P)-dependent oxidoreductase n=1 Tax=Mesorhizobium sp. CO1-1-8 TaxID=2876631 RepID=UPI001CD0E39F|nr:SDR family oxidoreductase [Mesorhizobium sp. CO1-1-8]MBZ9772486.1 SDR family oxidoreductase [Mesorhizobium sp. CO1-1-8]
MRLKGRTILLTGASAGIGAASARHFAEEGCELVLTARRPGPLQQLTAQINDAGGKAVCISADASVEADCQAAVDLALSHFGKLDGLFNNAGACLSGDNGLLDTSVDIWQASLTLNLSSVFFMCRAAVPHMENRPGAAIVNNAAMVAHIGSAHPQIAYCAAKGGVISMSREMAIELAPRGIRVNALSPGPVATELFQTLQDRDPEFLKTRMPHLPMKRFGKPEEIARVAAFLISDDSSFMTGQSVIADGGITSAYTTKGEARQ